MLELKKHLKVLKTSQRNSRIHNKGTVWKQRANYKIHYLAAKHADEQKVTGEPDTQLKNQLVYKLFKYCKTLPFEELISFNHFIVVYTRKSI